MILGQIENQKNSMAPLKICGNNGSILFLSSSIPNIELNRITINGDVLHFEVNSCNQCIFIIGKCAFDKPAKESSFANIAIPNQNEFILFLLGEAEILIIHLHFINKILINVNLLYPLHQSNLLFATHSYFYLVKISSDSTYIIYKLIIITFIMDPYKNRKFNRNKATSRSKAKKIQTLSSHKNLNPDYYLHLQRCAKKQKTKNQPSSNNYNSAHKLRSITRGQSQQPIPIKHPKKKNNPYHLATKSDRTRSSTVLNRCKKQVLKKSTAKISIEQVYSQTKQTLEAYKQQLKQLTCKNQELVTENERLRGFSVQK